MFTETQKEEMEKYIGQRLLEAAELFKDVYERQEEKIYWYKELSDNQQKLIQLYKEASLQHVIVIREAARTIQSLTELLDGLSKYFDDAEIAKCFKELSESNMRTVKILLDISDDIEQENAAGAGGTGGTDGDADGTEN